MEAVMLQSGLSMPGKETDKPESEETGIGDIPDKMSVLKIFDDGTALFLGMKHSILDEIEAYRTQALPLAFQSLGPKVCNGLLRSLVAMNSQS